MMRKYALPATIMFGALGACGGGGSGGVATSAPPPINSSLTDLRYSQSFVNDAATNDVSLDLATSTGISGTAQQASMTFRYDAATKGYAVTTATGSQNFGQADIQSSSVEDTIYQKSDGTYRDYLTLVHIPYSGTQPTRYVGMGYWQRNAVEAGRQDTDFSIFTYGLPTAARAVPRTGTAGFSVDAFGMASAPGQEPRSFFGRGDFNVDFGAGIFSTETYLTETTLVTNEGVVGGGIQLNASGHLSTTDGSFSGNALYQGWFGAAAGGLSGRFYGPNSEELGASFAGTNKDGMSVAGAFTGQRDSAVTQKNLTLTNMTQPQYFYAQFGTNSVGGLNWQNAETFTLSPPTSDLYGGQFTINDKVASADPNFTAYRKTFSSSYDSQDVALRLYKTGAANSELALTYASFGHWATSVPNGIGRSNVNLYFAYGQDTYARLTTGKTGTGRYQGVVYATGSNSPSGQTYDIKGASHFDVDFGAQRYSGGMTMKGTASSGGAIDFGGVDFAGALSAYGADTAANLTINGRAIGQLDFRFFGPDAQEIAGPFSLVMPNGNPGAGMVIMGVTAAKRQ